jgi:hypothetical protein
MPLNQPLGHHGCRSTTNKTGFCGLVRGRLRLASGKASSGMRRGFHLAKSSRVTLCFLHPELFMPTGRGRHLHDARIKNRSTIPRENTGRGTLDLFEFLEMWMPSEQEKKVGVLTLPPPSLEVLRSIPINAGCNLARSLHAWRVGS